MTQYQGECGHIKGHAYSVSFVHNETCVFWALGFHVYMIYMSLIIASCTPCQKTSFHSRVNSLNNMHADTLGARPLSLLERLSLISKDGICPFSVVILYYKYHFRMWYPFGPDQCPMSGVYYSKVSASRKV